MKKLLALAAVATASLFFLAPTPAEAGSYRSKVIGKCGGCGGHIHSFYRPVRLPCGNVRYSWVPSYHNNCRARATTYSQYRRVYGSPFVSSRYRSFSHRGHGFVSRGPSLSIRFGSSRGFCR